MLCRYCCSPSPDPAIPSTYLLEVVCRLELESSPALREAVLRTTLVNLSGREGSFTAADLMQEYFNQLLEAIVEKKGVEYDDFFIRHVFPAISIISHVSSWTFVLVLVCPSGAHVILLHISILRCAFS